MREVLWNILAACSPRRVIPLVVSRYTGRGAFSVNKAIAKLSG